MAAKKKKYTFDPKARYAVITDLHRGVYFGRVEPGYKTGDSFGVIHDLKICFHWEAKAGIGELVTLGPSKGSQVCPPCPRVELNEISKIMDVTNPDAIQRWLDQGWDNR